MKVLLFGGTSEGRALAQWLLERDVPFLVCVATQYGEDLLPPPVPVHVGRLGEDAMVALMEEGFTHVVDATHPYAQVVTRTIAAACGRANLPRLRLVRDGDVTGDWRTAVDAADAAAQLATLPGHILLTTGSKELDAFALPGLRERCWPRVLPSLDSLERCLALGFPQKQVICMQGPFSEELNTALLRQCGIDILVTKATGAAGGFWEKAAAARAAGCTLLVIGRSAHEEGLTMTGLIEILEREAGA